MSDGNDKLTDAKCAFCGGVLPQGRLRFCSEKCKNAFKHYRMSKAEVEARKTQKCLWCGKTFTHKFVGVRFCCSECRKKYENNGMKSRSVVTAEHRRTCPICGKTYVAYNTKQIYCSQKCRDVARNLEKTYTTGDAKTGFRDPYAMMMQEKANREAALECEFENVTNLPVEERRSIVSGWTDEKRKALRSFYIRKYELSAGKVLRSFRHEQDKKDMQNDEEMIVSEIRSGFERQSFDEDNIGFENS